MLYFSNKNISTGALENEAPYFWNSIGEIRHSSLDVDVGMSMVGRAENPRNSF